METKKQTQPWWVWETDYAEEGCTIIAAESDDEAKVEYLRMTGCDADTELSAKPVTAKDVVRLSALLDQEREEKARLREGAGIRAAVLEEAAKLADEAAEEFGDSCREEQATGAARVAYRIRGLIAKKEVAA